MISHGYNGDNTQLSDGRRARKLTEHCADCGVLIARGRRCLPCRDIHDQQARQHAYRQKKLRPQTQTAST